METLIVELLEKFIKPELLVLVAVLYFIGWILKSSKWFEDKYIPIALNIAGVILALIWVFSTSFPTTPNEYWTAVFTAIVQGVLVAGASVNVNQIYKQSTKEGE